MSECITDVWFLMQNAKFFWGGGTASSPYPSPTGKGTPPPHAPPTRRLDLNRSHSEFLPTLLLASIELSFHPCNILRDSRRGVSRGNKNVGCGTWKRRFFALAVWITGKLLKIDGYMLQGVWQTLNCLFIHASFCVIATGASPGQTKKWRPGYVKMAIFCNCGLNNWETVVDRRVHATRRFATCKHGNVFLSMQNLARLAKQRPQGKEKRG